SVSWYPDIPVENTASPTVSPTAPKAAPVNTRPSSSTSSAFCSSRRALIAALCSSRRALIAALCSSRRALIAASLTAPLFQPVCVFSPVVTTEGGVDLCPRRQPPPDRQDPVKSQRLTGDASLRADRGDRRLGDPQRGGATAFHQDAAGVAGQHSLRGVTQVADRDRFLPAWRNRAAHVQAVGRLYQDG